MVTGFVVALVIFISLVVILGANSGPQDGDSN